MAACPHIALVGFSGAGKSTVARLAAPRLGRPCLDTDAAIEQACGMKIPQIFSTRGEDYFRARETEALRRALDSHPPAIIACGGGVVTSPENFALLEEHALVVYLKVSPERALARIDELHSRPLLAQSGTHEVIAALMTSRLALYEALADLSITTDHHDPEEVCDLMIDRIREAGYEL